MTGNNCIVRVKFNNNTIMAKKSQQVNFWIKKYCLEEEF